MRIRKLHMLSMLIVFTFTLSMTNAPPTMAQTQIEPNFDAWFFTQAGSRITEAYALYIKQALAPLGIDVRVVAKPFGQFVGDLLHYTTGHPFDLAQIRFSGGDTTPGFMWKFHSVSTSFGRSMYQLHDEDWQAWQAVDSGVQTAEVDALLEDIEFELDLVERKALVDQFAELYMTKLLYDFPMVSSNFRTAMWRGFGGPNNELWDPDEGIFSSMALGATWESNEAIRSAVSGTDEIRLSQVNPSQKTFDPMQVFDTATGAITGLMADTSINFDKDFVAHPGLVYQWAITDTVPVDWDNNASTPATVGEQGRHIFFFRDDAFWPATTDIDGNAIASEALTADDMLFTLEILQLDNIVVNGQENYESMWDANVTTTLTTDDTLHVFIEGGKATPADQLIYGSYNSPMPRHILGGDLTYLGENGTVIGTMNELDDLGINPQEAEEWKHWASQSGHSLVGPYEIDEYVDNDFRSYVARDDYYFPNEAEIVDVYATNSASFAMYEAEDMFNMSLGHWAPHLNPTDPGAFYWDGITEMAIQTYYHVIIEDTNARLLAFESGAIDTFGSTSLGAQQVEDHVNSPLFVVKTVTPNRGPELLVFNLLHPHLKKINVRMAVAHALDKEQIVNIHDGFARRVDSPVWLSSGEYWYTPFPIDYDYETARDLMRSEGYRALETNNPITTPPQPPVTTLISSFTEVITGEVSTEVDTLTSEGNKIISNVTEALGNEFLFFLSGVAMMTIAGIRKKKK